MVFALVSSLVDLRINISVYMQSWLMVDRGRSILDACLRSILDACLPQLGAQNSR